MVYNNGLRFEDKQLQRLEQTDAVQYVGVQSGATPQAHHLQVASRLAAARKKLAVQIWWGPDPPHRWSRFCMANIELDAKIRAEFSARSSIP